MTSFRRMASGNTVWVPARVAIDNASHAKLNCVETLMVRSCDSSGESIDENLASNGTDSRRAGLPDGERCRPREGRDVRTDRKNEGSPGKARRIRGDSAGKHR